MSSVLPTKNIPHHKKEYDNVFETIYQLITHTLMEKACYTEVNIKQWFFCLEKNTDDNVFKTT